MKHKFTSLLFICLLIASTATSGCINWKDKGNGHVTTEKRNVADFHRIKVSQGIDLILIQDSFEEVEVKTDDNLQGILITEVNDGELRIYLDENVRRATKMEVTVTFRDITSLRASSGSDVVSEGKIIANQIELKASSSADMNLEIEAREIDCKLSSGSDIKLSGWSENLYIKASSGSDLNARDMISENCVVKASSGSDVDIYASNSLEVNASSGSDVAYKGNPKHTRLNASSGADIDKN